MWKSCWTNIWIVSDLRRHNAQVTVAPLAIRILFVGINKTQHFPLLVSFVFSVEKKNMSCCSVNSFDFASNFSSAKSNELTEQDMFCFNHTSAFYTSNNSMKMLMNDKKHRLQPEILPGIHVAMYWRHVL